MINKYIIAAAVAICAVFISYIIKFYLILGYGVSGDTATWGQFGEYVGGILNPILSFISLVLLIKSLTLQNDANESLRNDLKNSEKTEKTRSFEALFFSMISSQKELFNHFAIELNNGKEKTIKYSIDAVIEIDDNIEKIREKYDFDPESDKNIKIYLHDVDSRDQIFGLARVFYIIVKLISEKLSDINGFSPEDRKSHLHALVNFTDFSQLRMIILCMQFFDFKSIEYLREHNEFNTVLIEVGLAYNLY